MTLPTTTTAPDVVAGRPLPPPRRDAYQRGRDALRLDPYSPPHHPHEWPGAGASGERGADPREPVRR